MKSPIIIQYLFSSTLKPVICHLLSKTVRSKYIEGYPKLTLTKTQPFSLSFSSNLLNPLTRLNDHQPTKPDVLYTHLNALICQNENGGGGPITSQILALSLVSSVEENKSWYFLHNYRKMYDPFKILRDIHIQYFCTWYKVYWFTVNDNGCKWALGSMIKR